VVKRGIRFAQLHTRRSLIRSFITIITMIVC